MVTLFNQFTSKAFHLGEDGKYAEFHKSVMNGKLLVDYIARVGIGWSYNLFTANLSASMDSFTYKGNSEMSVDGLIADNVATSGRFARYSVAFGWECASKNRIRLTGRRRPRWDRPCRA